MDSALSRKSGLFSTNFPGFRGVVFSSWLDLPRDRQFCYGESLGVVVFGGLGPFNLDLVEDSVDRECPDPAVVAQDAHHAVGVKFCGPVVLEAEAVGYLVPPERACAAF